MFINKINSDRTVPAFKGYQHVQDNVGNDILRFNYPYDYEKETCEIQFFKVESLGRGEYKLVEEPILTKELQQGGIDVNLQALTDLDKDAPFAYRLVRKNKETNEVVYSGPDTGIKINTGEVGKNIRLSEKEEITLPEYTLVIRKGTTPKIQGAGYLGFPDSQRVGVFYHDFNSPNTGEIYENKEVQKAMENTIRTFSNKFGGNLAGLEKNVDYLSKIGTKVFFANPIAGGDNKSSHHYWNKNNFQISDDVGNVENFKSFTRKLFQKGITYVYDGTFTSEGLEGIHFQYALRWADKNPQTYYWFRMSSIKDTNLGLGVVPKHKDNLRFRLINAPRIWDEKSGKAGLNPDYNPNKETYIQIYDASQVTDGQISKLDKPIENYEKIKAGNPLDINSHDDTLINYICQVDPLEVIARFDAFEDFNKNNENPIKLNSPDGTILFAQFSNFKFEKKTEGGFQAWDANTDMAKMNYHISGYDEKINQAIPDRAERDYITKMQQRGAYEVQDMALQAGRYWTGLVKDAQTLYTAQVLKGAKTAEKIQELIGNGLLPKEASLEQGAIDNIISGYYNLEPKGVLGKDDVTVRALMKMPLDSLEFAENTVGVLSTSYFSNRATSAETLGKTRFELLKDENPHLVEPYEKIYSKVNILYLRELSNFTDEIIKKVNEKSNEKLLDENGDYTEYGEYVVENLAPSIAKYAFLKSLTSDKLKTKILPNGEITYDYKNIKELTTLKSLGINAVNPEDEAEQLLKLIETGMRNLKSTDVDYLAESILKSTEGLSVNSFRLAEASVKAAGVGLSWRLDAAKDVIDQDAVRNGETHFDESWQNVIDFWAKFVQQVKQENPYSYIVAEITDMEELMKASVGLDLDVYDNPTEMGNKFLSVNDALMKFFNETGITSEAAYSYFFTDLLLTFSAEFESGTFYPYDNGSSNFIWKIKNLVETRGVDFIRNLFTFAGNHDKPRLIHGLALDMGLFHADLGVFDDNGNLNYEKNRNHRLESMLQLTNSDSIKDLPIEAKLNLDNPEYFYTVSTKAVAMSQLLRFAINETLGKFAQADEIKYLKSALVDLTNGNYRDSDVINTDMNSIKIKELSSVEEALSYILREAGVQLSRTEMQKIIDKTNDKSLIEKYQVHGDFDWGEPNAHIGEANRNLLEKILRANHPEIPSGESDYYKYSLYTVNLAGLLQEAFLAVKGNDSVAKTRFLKAEKNFITKFDRKTVEENRSELPIVEDSALAMAKNGFGARDIQSAIEMLVKQAEYKARKDGKLNSDEFFINAEKIRSTLYKEATEPAVQKATMMYSFLNALIGIPTIYGGDELGMSGYEEKAKNVYLQNRNALPWSQLEEGPFKEFRSKVHKEMLEAIGIRPREGVEALNNGTAYLLGVTEDVPAFLMQDAYGNMTISLFNANDIDPASRVDYYEKLGINEANKKQFFDENNIESINPDNRFVPIQRNKEVDYIELAAGIALPVGLTFMNSDVRDKAVYVIEKIGDKLRLKKLGGKIEINGKTAKNGTMVLKHIAKTAKKIGFKGDSRLYNRQFNIVSNPYQKFETPIEGEKLSILTR